MYRSWGAPRRSLHGLGRRRRCRRRGHRLGLGLGHLARATRTPGAAPTLLLMGAGGVVATGLPVAVLAEGAAVAGHSAAAARLQGRSAAVPAALQLVFFLRRVGVSCGCLTGFGLFY